MRWAEVATEPDAAARWMASVGLVPKPEPRQAKRHAPHEQVRLPLDT
jgi:hypothetical protein